MPRLRRPRHRCATCAAPVSLLTAFRFGGRAYCRQTCAQAVRDARLKAQHDLADASNTICRCSGPPVPLESTGPHCLHCRRLFSSGVRMMLLDRGRPSRRLVDRVRAALHSEVDLPLMH